MIIKLALSILSTFSFAQAPKVIKKAYVPTAAEMKIIHEANTEFNKADCEPPPSVNMQIKMQSSVPEKANIKNKRGKTR